MKFYKGFNKDMSCRGFQYEEGKTYEEPEAKLCDRGFHACADPIDCFNHYGAANSVFHEVELDDLSEEQDKDSKVVAKKITIGAEINIRDIVKGHIEYVNEKITEAVEKGENEALKVGNYQKATVGDFGVATAGNFSVANTGVRGVATAGDGGVATAGDFGVATASDGGVATASDFGVASAGDRGVAKAGDGGVASAGDFGVAKAGYRGVANASDCGVATASDFGVASAGDRGVAKAGDGGVAVSRGSSETDANGISIARGNRVKAKGKIGTLLVVAKENSKDFRIKSYAVGIVDGEDIKENVWYMCADGKLVEVAE